MGNLMKKISYLLLSLLFFTFPSFSAYSIIIDAGSTGSRLHLFEYTKDQDKLPQIKDIFSTTLKPGIASFAKNPDQAGLYIKKLLDQAMQQLKAKHINANEVPVSLLATAGMRLLSEQEQQKIHTTVRDYIYDHYNFPINTVTTITGQDEGLFGWLDINYLLETFAHHAPTVGSLDMGGASTQITFAVENNNYPADTVNLRIGQQDYFVFSKSFLGLGLDQARLAMSNSPLVYACYPANFPLATPGKFDFSTCESLYSDVISHHQVKETLPPFSQQQFIGHSGIQLNYSFFLPGTASNEAHYETKLTEACAKNWEQWQIDFKDIPADRLKNYCNDGSYVAELLYKVYQLKDNQLTITDKINNQKIDWTLGALLYQLSM